MFVKIGELINHNGKTYRCVPRNGDCGDCSLASIDGWSCSGEKYNCTDLLRIDGTDVKFVEVKVCAEQTQEEK